MRRVRRAVRLDPFLYRAVAEDASLTREAVAVAVISALMMGLGLVLVRSLSVLWWLVGSIAWASFVVGLGSWFFATVGRRLGGNARFDEMVRGIGYAVVPQAIGFIPVAGFVPGFVVGGLWTTACVVVAIREIHDISTGLAVRLVLAALFVIVAFIPLIVTATQAGG